MKPILKSAWAGACAGAVTGLLGAGGGMVLVLGKSQPFAGSVAVMLPICLVSVLTSGAPLPWGEAMPYLLGSSLGGLGAGLWGKKIPTLWLHRCFGTLLLLGGLRTLW